MNRMRTVDNGNIIPAQAERREFAHDLWDTIRDQILSGRTKMTKLVDGGRMTFNLPLPMQILDFVAMKQAQDPAAIIVQLRLPGTDITKDAWDDIAFEYKPPKY